MSRRLKSCFAQLAWCIVNFDACQSWRSSQIDTECTVHSEKQKKKKPHKFNSWKMTVVHKGDRPQSVTLKAFKLFDGLKIQLQKGGKKTQAQNCISPVYSRRPNGSDSFSEAEVSCQGGR